MRAKNPITVKKGWHSLRGVGWEWRCAIHVRGKGFHHRNRRKDWVLKLRGKPPDVHPWVSCMAGAIKHYHLHHADVNCCHQRKGVE